MKVLMGILMTAAVITALLAKELGAFIDEIM